MKKDTLQIANTISEEIDQINKVLKLLEYKEYDTETITLLETFCQQKLYLEYEINNVIDSVDVPIEIDKKLIEYLRTALSKRLVELENAFAQL